MRGLTCNACNREFEDDAEQKLHYRSEWHRYNCIFVIQKWVVQGALNMDIGANPSAEGADGDEGVDDQAIKFVDIADTLRLQEQLSFDKK